MDWPATGLEPDLHTDSHLFRRAYASVTLPWTDVESQQTASPPLTSGSAGVMLFTRQQLDHPTAALDSFRSIRTQNRVYTEFGIDPSSL